MKRTDWTQHLQDERGMVMVAAMMVMALLAILSVTGIATSSLEVKISSHDRDAKQAFYLAEAGLEMAKYEIVKGWEKGSAAATGGPDEYTFTFDSAPANAAWWDTNKWAGFTLVDRAGTPCAISANTDGSVTFQVTCTTPGPALDNGPARIYFESPPSAAYSDTGTAGVSKMVISGAPWGTTPTANMWDDTALEDSAGNFFTISISGVSYNAGPPVETTLALSATPASGPFTIHRAVAQTTASPLEFRWYEDADSGGLVIGAPSLVWTASSPAYGFTADAWYLIDSDGDLFRITATSFPITTGTPYMKFELDGPAADLSHGNFQVVCGPWLATVAGATPSTVSYTQAADFSAPSGLTGYGGVVVEVARNAASQGLYDVIATSTTSGVGNRKAIALDAHVEGDGNVFISNWRQTR